MPEKPAYDLLVLIDADAPEERRMAVIEGVKKQIDGGDGALKGDVDWGVRRLAYEIDHRPEAYYHLFQLEAAPSLLKQLEHSLAIDDVVLRHRVIRLTGPPPATPPRPAPTGPRQQVPAEPDDAGDGTMREEAPAHAEE
jgi:small subunit ribosomal protein S6